MLVHNVQIVPVRLPVLVPSLKVMSIKHYLFSYSCIHIHISNFDIFEISMEDYEDSVPCTHYCYILVYSYTRIYRRNLDEVSQPAHMTVH